MEAFTKQIGLRSKEGGTLFGTEPITEPFVARNPFWNRTLYYTGRTRTRRPVTSTYWSRSESQSDPRKVAAVESRPTIPKVVVFKFFGSPGFVSERSLAKPKSSLSTPSAGNSCGGLAFDTARLLPRSSADVATRALFHLALHHGRPELDCSDCY